MDWGIFSYVIIGLTSGIGAGFFGMGGGTIIVPVMLTLGYSFEHAIGISVMQMMFSSTFGSIINYKKKLLNISDGIYAGIGGLIGASFSGLILSVIDTKKLTILFLIITFYSFVKYAFNIKYSTNAAPPIKSQFYQRLILILTGIITGIFAISLGIGGGLLMVPILGYYLGYESKRVVPLGLFFVIFSSISGTISFQNHNVIDAQVLHTGIYIGVASILGVWLGIKLIQISSPKLHRMALLSVYGLSMLVTAYNLITS
ncbi:hypothetical protein BKH41_07940 [Helicobacter sp. 12S02232-10]|uniref:sulfite exporter TauE/SafE family protein n=1 Tax=Helicobacter sp. 12S02232-10 TaxID=1476197 RepID=UPI000BA6C506|nr:sulfite exporter TauE/SafE family protein [Helicobacter sp. 12S02232-10]PAF47202.1 hypothetical protein BKH41_07940 [Helicobacter sp. 12S02232-10]